MGQTLRNRVTFPCIIAEDRLSSDSPRIGAAYGESETAEVSDGPEYLPLRGANGGGLPTLTRVSLPGECAMNRWVGLLLGLGACGGLQALFPQVPTPEAVQRKARAVLAQLSGTITLPGLKEPVEVLRDRWGVPHLYAKNQHDLFFAQGFVVAQDRLFQLEIWRRRARGEMAELIGESALEGDRFARLLRYRGDMAAEWVNYSPDTRQIVTAFTNGINACIDHLGTKVPVEFQQLGITPGKWEPTDCLGRMSGILMSSNFQNEIARAQLVAALGIEKARRVAPVDPVLAYSVPMGLDLEGIDDQVLASYRRATRPFRLAPEGSNNWAIHGTRSASGKPLLAGDPHRALDLPSLRYVVHLNAPGWNVIGSGEPALPGVAIGHNERIAWAFTIVGTDQADFYVEETNPANPNEYRVGDQWESMAALPASITVKGAAQPVEVALRYTRHGPVVYEDRARRRAYALRWAGSEPGGAAYLDSLALDRAGNWQEFLAALKGWKIPALNMMYADVDGNIGWVAAGATPLRKGWDGLLPVPGATGAYEWQGFLDVPQLPQAFNPPSGWLATANHNILPEGYPHSLTREWSTPYRYERIKQRLLAKEKFDVEDCKRMQYDTTSIPGQLLARLARERLSGMPDAELLAQWDSNLTRETRGGLLYVAWLQELQAAFFCTQVPEAMLPLVSGRQGIRTLVDALEKPDRFWFGSDPEAGRDRMLRETLTAAAARVRKRLGNESAKWEWGALHRVTFRHPLGAPFDLPPVAMPGDGHTPNAASHTRDFAMISGASYRQVFDLADWDRGWATSAPGQSGQPESEHYADLLLLWAKGDYFPLAFSRKKVEEVTRHRLQLLPGR